MSEIPFCYDIDDFSNCIIYYESKERMPVFVHLLSVNGWIRHCVSGILDCQKELKFFIDQKVPD